MVRHIDSGYGPNVVSRVGAPVPTIAIVDDDPSMRRSLFRVVESAGYRAATFSGGREFLEWLRHGQADCLVLDVHMSEMSGFDVQDRTAVPIVFITAHDDGATRDRLERSGAAAHLYKPFDAPTLVGAIRRALLDFGPTVC